jgi:hypothetical protein
MTAALLRETLDTTSHTVAQSLGNAQSGGGVETLEVFARPSGRGIQLWIGWGIAQATVNIDIDTQTVLSTSASSVVIDDYGVEEQAGGFYRVWLSAHSNYAYDTLDFAALGLVDVGADSILYAGDGTSGVYATQYRVYHGPLRPFSAIDDLNATLYLRTTNDDPSGSPAWSEPRQFLVGDYTARAFWPQLRLASADTNHNVLVTAASVTVDMPDRVEQGGGIVSGAGTKSVAFAHPFRETPAVGITAQDMQTGDYFAVSGKSASGFDIVFRNSAGTAVSRTFDYMAKGYGKQTA